MEADSTGDQGSRRAVALSDDYDDDAVTFSLLNPNTFVSICS